MQEINRVLIDAYEDGSGAAYQIDVRMEAYGPEHAVERLKAFYDSSCQHSYDCCGHWYGYVQAATVTYVRDHVWTFHYVTYQNI